MNVFERASSLYQKSINRRITTRELDEIIGWPDEELSLLFACADQVRVKFCSSRVDPCSLMNIKSGGCSEDCAFCAQSAHNGAAVEIHGLASGEAIIKQAGLAFSNHLPFCVVSSGRRLSREEILSVADALRKCPGEKHASLGILDEEEFLILRDAGVSCYNHNIETSRRFFGKIVTTHTYDQRIATVERAKKAGLKVCCGGIFGMGESWDDRKDMCMELRRLAVDTVPINFLIPIDGTPVAPPNESPLEFLRIVSMLRLAMPSQTIKVCGGREANLGPLQHLIFFAGANGYISGGYLTTRGAGVEADDLMIRAMGLTKRLEHP